MKALDGIRGLFNYLGLFLILIGIAPLLAGWNGLQTPIPPANCPVNGCPPPSVNVWQFYELSYIEFFSGLILIIAGIICLSIAQTILRRKGNLAVYSFPPRESVNQSIHFQLFCLNEIALNRARIVVVVAVVVVLVLVSLIALFSLHWVPSSSPPVYCETTTYVVTSTTPTGNSVHTTIVERNSTLTGIISPIIVLSTVTTVSCR